MDTLLQLDRELFLFLNGFHSPLWDNFFWIHTSVIIWVPFYLSLLYVIFKEQGKWGFITILAIVLLVVLCDQISSTVLKDSIQRLRPSREPSLQGVVHLVNNKTSGMYGFVSGHATNSFGLALFTSLLIRFRWYTVFIMIWAAANSYSRIYMGVHYPGDIIGGTILGLSLGWLVYRLLKKVESRYAKEKYLINGTNFLEFSVSSAQLLMISGGVIIITIFLSSKLLLQLM